MPRQGTIVITGYRETARAFTRVNRKAKYAIFKGMRAAAEPIAADARRRLADYRGMDTSTIKPSARIAGVFIVQRHKKVGKHPDFGSLQMIEGLIPALKGRDDDVATAIETAFIGLTRREGF